MNQGEKLLVEKVADWVGGLLRGEVSTWFIIFVSCVAVDFLIDHIFCMGSKDNVCFLAFGSITFPTNVRGAASDSLVSSIPTPSGSSDQGYHRSCR